MSLGAKIWRGSLLCLSLALSLGVQAFNRNSTTGADDRHQLGVQFEGFSQSIHTDQDSTQGDRTYRENFGRGMLLNWDMPHAGLRWWPYFKFGLRWIEQQERGTVKFDSNKMAVMGMGGKYFLNPKWILFSEFSLEQEHFLNHLFPSSADAYSELTQVALPKVRLGAQTLLWQKNKWDIDSTAFLLSYLPKQTGPMKVQRGIGFGAKVGGEYWFSSEYRLASHLWYEWMKNKVKSPTFANQSNRSNLGIDLSATWRF